MVKNLSDEGRGKDLCGKHSNHNDAIEIYSLAKGMDSEFTESCQQQLLTLKKYAEAYNHGKKLQ